MAVNRSVRLVTSTCKAPDTRCRIQIKGSLTKEQHNPSSHATVVAKYANAGAAEVNSAIDQALKAKESWETLPFSDRAAVFLKAADLISGKYRYDIMAATMIGQGKNAWQAEIDAAAELADFLRYAWSYMIWASSDMSMESSRLTIEQIQCPVC